MNAEGVGYYNLNTLIFSKHYRDFLFKKYHLVKHY